MDLKNPADNDLYAIAKEIQEIDVKISALFERVRELEAPLTMEEKNRLFRIVSSDGKPHWM